MGTSTLLQSMFRHKAWANEELFAELAQVDPATHAAERQDSHRPTSGSGLHRPRPIHLRPEHDSGTHTDCDG